MMSTNVNLVGILLSGEFPKKKDKVVFTNAKVSRFFIKRSWNQIQNDVSYNFFFLVKPGKDYTQRYNCNQAVEGTEAWLLYKSK